MMSPGLRESSSLFFASNGYSALYFLSVTVDVLAGAVTVDVLAGAVTSVKIKDYLISNLHNDTLNVISG